MVMLLQFLLLLHSNTLFVIIVIQQCILLLLTFQSNFCLLGNSAIICRTTALNQRCAFIKIFNGFMFSAQQPFSSKYYPIGVNEKPLQARYVCTSLIVLRYIYTYNTITTTWYTIATHSKPPGSCKLCSYSARSLGNIPFYLSNCIYLMLPLCFILHNHKEL